MIDDGFLPGVLMGTVLTGLVCIATLSDKNTAGEKFAIESMAQTFSVANGFTQHVCTVTGNYYNQCYGKLGSGIIVQFECSADDGCRSVVQ